MRDNPDTQDRILLSKFECYGKFTPTILNDVGHYSAEELRNKFPLLCSSFDFEHCVWHTERKAKVLKLIARKPIDN